MPNAIARAIESRISRSRFEPGREISVADIEELVRLATLAPSAYNCQNWRFVAVRSASAKAALQALAYGQPKVGEAAAVFIVIGEQALTAQLPGILQAADDAGALPPDIVSRWLEMAGAAYADHPVPQRDEAFRSASLAAMTLMLAAAGMGLASCPMSGFDAAEVARRFALAASEIPVLLVAVGYPSSHDEIRKPRRPVAEVLAFA